jgi:hypothetical protein
MRKARPQVPTMTRLAFADANVLTSDGLARSYAFGAGECLADAQVLQKEPFSDRTGHFMIMLHAIELGLKGFLITHGFTEQILRSKPFGHDLVELHKAAKGKGLVLTTPHAEELIEWINEWHCEGVKIRYEFAKDRELPTSQVLIPLANEIVRQTMLRTDPPAAEQTSLPMPVRVSPLNSDDSPVEVHSISSGGDPYLYARRLIEADRKASRPDRRYLIERGGEKAIYSAEEIIKLGTARTQQKNVP